MAVNGTNQDTMKNTTPKDNMPQPTLRMPGGGAPASGGEAAWAGSPESPAREASAGSAGSGPELTGAAPQVLAGTVVANIVRNLWANTVIVCGHFPEGVETFERSSIDGETRGEWYLRQMLGSANISGGFLMHFMTGNLSHQIEHHLYPDMPSNRYRQIAPQIRSIMDRYELNYVTGSLPKQFGSVYKRILQLSVPNPVEGQSRLTTIKVGFEKLRKTRKALKARKASAKAKLAAARG